ncbi:MAG: 16S rRNA (cytosine(967)-C(5))-methyltransferase RsmB [Acidimicrobiia bacterium]|nr:16S rRNA (cytosine(967)-C(5))-methyltransferase RsmB [Acidimicrobiia bacterium]
MTDTNVKQTARGVALAALVRIEDGAYANVALPAILRRSELDTRSRAQATDLVYGTLRRQRSLDYLLSQKMNRKIAALDPPVRAALRMGVFQLVEGVPAHAAVGETVTEIGLVQAYARGYVNAVLRRVSEMGPDWPWPQGDNTKSLAVRTSMPDWIAELLVNDLGYESARGMLEAANRPGVLTLRPNMLRTSCDDLVKELERDGATVQRGALIEDSLLVYGAGDPAILPAIAAGRATPQDQASQEVARLVGAQPGECILEIGAAPGGKATAIAEAMNDTGQVVALDSDTGRLRLVTNAKARLGLQSVTAVAADGRKPGLRPNHFDRVLVDAPCTGLGVLSRRPEARWRLRPEQISQLGNLQRELLTSAAGLVKPGGLLVYSVCTLTAVETHAIGDWAVNTFDGLVPEPLPDAPWEQDGPGARLLPQAAGTDGMWILRLRKRNPGAG